MKKKILSFCLFLCLLPGLCACAGKEAETSTPETTLPVPAENTQPRTFDFGDIHYTLNIPVYEIVRAKGIWGPVEYGDFVYNEQGQLIRKSDLTNSSYVYTYEYDELGRLIRETEVSPYGDTTYTFQYNTQALPEGSFHYVEATETHNFRGLIDGEKAESWDSDLDGRILVYDYQFDEAGRVIQIAHSNPSYGSRIVFDLEYNDYGWITRTHQRSYYNGVLTDQWENILTYDGLGRLLRTDFRSLSDGYQNYFLTEYGVTRTSEISTVTDPVLKTTDLWVGFDQEPGIPMPDSCIRGIRLTEQKTEAAEATYRFLLSTNRAEADQEVLKYLAILSDVCGLTTQITEGQILISGGGIRSVSLLTGSTPEEGCFLLMRIPLTDGVPEAATAFTNKFGTPETRCVHRNCTNFIASSGDTNCCEEHSNRCGNCDCYIDADAIYCVSCLSGES